MFLSYIKNIFFTTITTITIVIVVNYFVDPGAIYSRSGDKFPKEYAKSLTKSDNGLYWSSETVSERDLTVSLSSYIGSVDCVIIGSSHVMQISNYGNHKSLNEVCNSILNLAVSGGGIEDHLVLTYLAIKNGSPKKIILGVDAWTLTQKSNSIGSRVESSDKYFANYKAAQIEILKSIQKSNVDFIKYLNLINLEYFVKSVSLLWKQINGEDSLKRITNVKEKIDVIKGVKNAVKLPDGSLVYPSAYIDKTKENAIPKEYFYYKNRTGNTISNSYFINIYNQILSYIIKSGVEPIILLTPYHKNLWKFKGSSIVSSISKNEEVIKKIGSSLGISVLGSYDPVKLGCENHEFYDFQHATRECLTRITKE